MFTFTSLPTHVEHVTCTRHNFYCPTIPIYPNNTMFYIFVVGTKTAGGVLDWFSYFDWGKSKHMAKYISSHTTDHTDESEPAVWLYLVVSRESPPLVRNIRVSSVALFYPLVCLYVGTVWTKYRYIAAHTRTYNWLEQLIRCLGGSYFTYLHPPNILHYLYPLPILIIRSLSS